MRLIPLIAKTFLKEDWQHLNKRLSIQLNKFKREQIQVPIILVKLLISAEDHRFFRHNGIDVIAIFRASWRRLFRGKWEGASTIEMQLVRVLTQDYEFSFRRKLKEMLLASLVNEVVPKHLIPSLYLQRAYFGWEMNGLEQVFKKLNIESNKLTPEQAAGVIARIKYPESKGVSLVRVQQIKKRIHYYYSSIYSTF